MARYSRYIEQTFRRHFRKAFDWVAFNLVVLRLRRRSGEELIGAFLLSSRCKYTSFEVPKDRRSLGARPEAGPLTYRQASKTVTLDWGL
ncbi:MAG: hypothetical protein ABEK75_01565 [Salinibacter sp.]